VTRLHADLPGVSNSAQESARGHLGVLPGREAWRRMVLDILDRRAVLLTVDGRHSPNGWREVWLAELAGLSLRVVWSPDGGLAIAVLPLRQRPLSHRMLHVDACKHGQPTRAVPRRALAREHDWFALA
jgi:hypothetical protein